MELVEVLSFLLDRYIAINLLFLFAHANTVFFGRVEMPVAFFIVLMYSALAQFSAGIYVNLFLRIYVKSLIPLKLHFPLVGGTKLKLLLF